MFWVYISVVVEGLPGEGCQQVRVQQYLLSPLAGDLQVQAHPYYPVVPAVVKLSTEFCMGSSRISPPDLNGHQIETGHQLQTGQKLGNGQPASHRSKLAKKYKLNHKQQKQQATSSKLTQTSKLTRTSCKLTRTSSTLTRTSCKLATVSSPFRQARSVLLNGVLLEMKGSSLPDIRWTFQLARCGSVTVSRCDSPVPRFDSVTV